MNAEKCPSSSDDSLCSAPSAPSSGFETVEVPKRCVSSSKLGNDADGTTVVEAAATDGSLGRAGEQATSGGWSFSAAVRFFVLGVSPSSVSGLSTAGEEGG